MAGKLRTRFLILVTEKEQREGRRIRANEIAMITGVNPATVARWLHNEVNKFDGPVLEAFCKYFQCEIGELLYMDWEAEG